MSKPAVSKLQERGIKIRAVDSATDGVPTLVAAFKGVDTLICVLVFTEIDNQTKLADAAKLAGVKRFITDDWSPAAKSSLMFAAAESQDPGLCEVHRPWIHLH